jgi:hypothetical protein
VRCLHIEIQNILNKSVVEPKKRWLGARWITLYSYNTICIWYACAVPRVQRSSRTYDISYTAGGPCSAAPTPPILPADEFPALSVPVTFDTLCPGGNYIRARARTHARRQHFFPPLPSPRAHTHTHTRVYRYDRRAFNWIFKQDLCVRVQKLRIYFYLHPLPTRQQTHMTIPSGGWLTPKCIVCTRVI